MWRFIVAGVLLATSFPVYSQTTVTRASGTPLTIGTFPYSVGVSRVADSPLIRVNSTTIAAPTINATTALTGPTLDTGQGANELYPMDQAVRTADSPTFAGLTTTTLNITTGNFGTINLTNALSSSAIETNMRRTSIGFTSFDGTAIATGKVKGFYTCPYAATITGWNIVADAGTCTVKVWKIASGTAKPTIANVINTSGVSLSSGTAVHSATVTDFTTTTVTANDIFAFDITAVSGMTELTFNLELTR